ncbi:MAG TPA: exopolysaccharide biosynthesis polyprenyl glycosylphosphotransferase [Candidatus Saccharimonadales bacterium]|nr:exopolysaccharide biosynthesis polyprenyl glycosylphosphotransferase [Candidatus Saccharimonadales bacterium]
MKNNISLIYNACLVVGDFFALIAAFVAAYIIRVKVDDRPLLEPIQALTYLKLFLIVLPFWILIFAWMGLYNSSIYEKRFQELGRLFVGSFIGLLFVVFLDFVVKEPLFPARLVPIYGFAFGFLFLVVFRNLVRLIRVWLFSFNIGITQVALVGNSPVTPELVDWLSNTRKSGYKIIAVVGQKRTVGDRDVPTFPTFQAFLDHNKKDLHGIVQTELYADESKNAEVLTYAQENHVSYRFIPANTGLFVGNLEVELFRSSIPVVTVHQTALFGWGRVVKRIFDLIFGVIFLILASPLLLLTTIVLMFDHGDPIWRNTRLSRYGTKIGMYKFRTQYHAYHRMTPEEGFAKMGKPELAKKYRDNGDYLEDDPRISTIGRFLRRTSLDELPQLFNVLKGDMSLVGPRPLEPFELSNYDKKSLMLSVKTGLTGLAAVSGRRDISFEERRALDLYYVQNWSLWLDLVIIAKTFRAVFGRRGAM